MAARALRIATLSSCSSPDTIHGLRSFIGAYKVLGRVVPHYSQLVSDLYSAVAERQFQERINRSDELLQSFRNAQKSLSSRKSIILPRPDDHFWIVTDASASKCGIEATLYVSRNDKLLLVGFFGAKLRKHQVTWVPCEVEALGIATAVKHFSPYIIQSKLNACVLVDI